MYVKFLQIVLKKKKSNIFAAARFKMIVSCSIMSGYLKTLTDLSLD